MAKDALHEFLTEVNKAFGDGMAIILDENKVFKVDAIPTGVGVIDEAIGVGGIPRGRITEVFGNEACGKTTLCLHAIAQAQKQGLNALFIDAEHSLSPERMQAIGIDTSKLVISQPDSGEHALDLVDMAARSGDFAIVVVDSVAALTPQTEYDKDMGDSVMGVHARLMSQAMRKLTAPISKSNTALMFTNQTRAKIGGYGAAETTTGGNALKFYASLRIRMQFTGKIENTKGERISGKYRATIVKNKMAVPFKVADFEINKNGIDDSGYIVQLLLDGGVLEKSGSFIKYEGEVIAQGVRAAAQAIHDDEELKTKLMQSLHKLQQKSS